MFLLCFFAKLRKLLKCIILLSDDIDRSRYFYAIDKLGPLVSDLAVRECSNVKECSLAH
jgi:hypothetical protein